MTTALHPAPFVTDTVLDTGLADLIGSLSAPDPQPWSLPEVVALLARATTLRGGSELRAATRTAAERLERSLSGTGAPAPGLGGAAGAVWALVEAARAIDDKALGWRALTVAATIPVRSPDPGITHGAAGAGMAQLRLWLAYRDRRAATRVRECVDGLVRTSTTGAGTGIGRIGWPDAGGAGFAHGMAGIGTFLLAAGRTVGARSALRTANAVAATLHATGIGADPAGIGSFLARHWAATGDRRSLELAEAAALVVAVAVDPAAGHFLLDLAEITGDRAHRDRAAELATRLRHLGDPQSLAFLLRLRHGGPRPWLAGELETGMLRHP